MKALKAALVRVLPGVRVTSKRAKYARYRQSVAGRSVSVQPGRASVWVCIAHPDFGAVEVRGRRRAGRILRQATRGVGPLANLAGFPENLAR